MTSTRGPAIMLSGLALLLVTAGVLPWVAGGSAAARGFGAPLLLVGLFAAYAVVRASRPAAPTPAATQAATPAATQAGAAGGCGGCQCGAGGCGAATPTQG
jgi:hypothetical protein